jgi:hypothetical protein
LAAALVLVPGLNKVESLRPYHSLLQLAAALVLVPGLNKVESLRPCRIFRFKAAALAPGLNKAEMNPLNISPRLDEDSSIKSASVMTK